MGTKLQNGHSPKSRQHTATKHGLGRSRLGWLKVRFDGGPSYPEMIEILREMVERHGHLVRRGEQISGFEWIQRIEQSGAQISSHQKLSIQTLMEEI